MLPRGLQSSQPFNRSCARLLTARYATTPSLAFSTSPTRCNTSGTRANKERAERQTFDKGNEREPHIKRRDSDPDAGKVHYIKPLIRYHAVASPHRVRVRYVRAGGENVASQRATKEAEKEEEKEEEKEVYPTRGELQEWFNQFIAERSIPGFKDTTQAQPRESPKMRVRKRIVPDKVQSEEEVIKLEDLDLSGPTENKKRRGTLGSTTSGEPGKQVDTRTSSVDMAEKKADSQSNIDDGPAIIVLNGVSRSLVESDFRYLAGHGQLVDGWTYGLVKVVQSRSRITHEPRGSYLLFFDTEHNARAYINVLERLHIKSRLRLPKEWQPKSTDMPESTATLTPVRVAAKQESPEVVDDSPNALPNVTKLYVDKLPDMDERQDMDDWQGDNLKRRSKPDDDLDANRYTLLPPTTPLHYQIFTRHNILEYENIREAKKGLRPHQILSPPPTSGRSAAEVPAPPKDLIDYAQNPPIEHSKTKVLVYLVGAKLTTRALRTAIEMDAEARNYPWQLVQEDEDTATTTTAATKKTTEELLGKGETDPAIKPIMSTLSIIKFSKFNDHRIEHEVDEFSDGKTEEGEMYGFSRFVVSFVDVTEARRFVRTWHKREMLDPRTERMVQVNVTALW
ncbi:hypothetical protein B0T20DRAFT_410279 [Sordaria brevicollis]|uniref:Uncharacterized protein n=1 Tax=Sordaria brevicollis TaxID=83679 RepID=A0AAE0PE00_SORBR|nr:hypothetical protein B0T20DRAFT_410279 [Sordaria brevicollis]